MPAITITNAIVNLMRDGLSGATNPVVTYVAVGSSTTAPTTSDTQLGSEFFRKSVTSYVNGSTGEVIISMYLGPGDAVGGNIQEVGFFGGSAATSTSNTGVLIARGLYSHNPKTGTESIQFSLDITI
jgi:hypothetical protein